MSTPPNAPPSTTAALVLAAALASPALASAQDGNDAQVRNRARWRVSLEPGAAVTNATGALIDAADAQSASPFVGASVGASAWRAVHPWIDLGARVGVLVPEVRDVQLRSALLACPANQYPGGVATQRTVGFTPYAALAARARVLGPRIPVHLDVGVLGVLWVAPSGYDADWQCTSTDPGTGMFVVNARHTQRVGGGVIASFAAVTGMTSHFGASEEFSVGFQVWIPVGVTAESHFTYALMFGYELTRGEALPADARRRGSIASGVVGGVGALLLAGAWGALLIGSHIG